MNIKNTLQHKIAESLETTFDFKISEKEVHLERPQDMSHGDWASNAAMTLAGKLKKNPREIAEKIKKTLETMSIENVDSIEIAGPGFINFRLNNSYFQNNLKDLIKKKEYIGSGEDLKGKRIMVEFAHPNPFKAFHIGHLRNIILGESIIRLLKSQGAEVIRTNYQGDVGMHIAKSLWALKKIDPKDYPKDSDERVSLIGKSYAKGATAFEENEETKQEIREINKKIYSKEDPEINKLWEMGKKWSLDKFHEIYERVDSTFDREYMESETLETCMGHIQRAKDKGILMESDGAVIFDGSAYGLDTRVFLNSEGLPTYEGKELGLAYMEFSDFGKIDLCIHNVAVEQISFFKVTFKVEELLDPGIFKGKQYHNAYEFVGLKKGKMSSRKGNVVLGNEILNEAYEKVLKVVKGKKIAENSTETAEIIGVGAVKYSFLKISPFKYLAFDLEESLNFEGDSGPYIQYTYTRTQSILKKANQNSEYDFNPETLVEKEETEVLKWLERFDEVVSLATRDYSPNFIAAYLFELTQKFNRFYKSVTVLNAEESEKNSRLALVEVVGETIKKGLDLLGIKAPEKM